MKCLALSPTHLSLGQPEKDRSQHLPHGLLNPQNMPWILDDQLTDCACKVGLSRKDTSTEAVCIIFGQLPFRHWNAFLSLAQNINRMVCLWTIMSHRIPFRFLAILKYVWGNSVPIIYNFKMQSVWDGQLIINFETTHILSAECIPYCFRWAESFRWIEFICSRQKMNDSIQRKISNQHDRRLPYSGMIKSTPF